MRTLAFFFLYFFFFILFYRIRIRKDCRIEFAYSRHAMDLWLV